MEKQTYENLADVIISSIGGKQNVSSLTHCTTRLRFRLVNDALADIETVKDIDGVITVVKSSGQFQVVIGSHVAKVYDAIMSKIEMSDSKDDKVNGVFNQLIDIISGVFQPLLGPLCATGVIKGVTALLLMLKVVESTSGTIIVLNALGDALFFFMPILIGYTSANKFKLNPFIGMVIGAVLCYPSIQGGALSALNGGQPLMTLFEGTMFTSKIHATFLGVPLIGITYTSSVLPVIFITWAASKLQRKFEKFITPTLQSILVPFLVLLIALPVGLLVIGPIITYAATIASQCFAHLYSFSPILCGLFIGFFWQLLVMFGIHWGMVPIVLMNIGTMGYDQVLCGTFGATFAQTAVVAALYIKSRNKEFKALCIPAMISGIFGITEPAIYGITLPRKKTFFYSMVGGAVSGTIIGFFNVKRYAMGGGGLVGIVNFLNPATGDANGFIIILIASFIAMVTSFLLTIFFWKDDTGETKSHKTMFRKEQIKAPLIGTTIPLQDTSDKAFSEGLLGKGITILPKEGCVYAPFDGTVVATFPTKHAIGIMSETGVELLIHVGLNTVELEGKYFDLKVAQGDKIYAGQVLLTFDIVKLKELGYCLETPVVITNSSNDMMVTSEGGKEIALGDPMLTIDTLQGAQ